MSDLETELQAIDGVGEATAEKIMAVLEAHTETPEEIQKAYHYAKEGKADMAASYLNEVLADE